MNIISKEAITSFKQWPAHVVGFIIILSIIIITIYSCKSKNIDILVDLGLIIMVGGTILFLITYGLCSLFYRYDTGRYKYTATLDDSYSINEIYENYTNISYDENTNIYTFEDKVVK